LIGRALPLLPLFSSLYDDFAFGLLCFSAIAVTVRTATANANTNENLICFL
jgi:hypothetical protein